MHRLRLGAKQGAGAAEVAGEVSGAGGGGPRRDRDRDRDGGDAASRLLPRFHRAAPSSSGRAAALPLRTPGRPLPPAGPRSGARDPGRPKGRAGGEPGPRTRPLGDRARPGAPPARRLGGMGPAPRTRGKPRLQKLDAPAGRPPRSGRRCRLPGRRAPGGLGRGAGGAAAGSEGPARPLPSPRPEGGAPRRRLGSRGLRRLPLPRPPAAAPPPGERAAAETASRNGREGGTRTELPARGGGGPRTPPPADPAGPAEQSATRGGDVRGDITGRLGHGARRPRVGGGGPAATPPPPGARAEGPRRPPVLPVLPDTARCGGSRFSSSRQRSSKPTPKKK